MKTIKITLITFFLLIISHFSFSQDISKDTTLANNYYELAFQFINNIELDSAYFYAVKAQNLYFKHLGETSLQYSNTLYFLGNIYQYSYDYEKSLEAFQKALKIRLELFGEKNINVASSYIDIGFLYKEIDKNDLALENYEKALKICLEILEENDPYFATIYNNIGSIYENKSLYDLALINYIKSLNIRIANFGSNHIKIATSYNNIGSVYNSTGELDKALKYYEAALKILLNYSDEKQPNIASLYNNFGNVYESKGEYDKALNYYFKALNIRLEIIGENTLDAATSYNNIGYVFKDKSEYDKAMEYFEKALNIRIEISGEINSDVAGSYTNIGTIYLAKRNFAEALKYFEKSLKINLEISGENSPEVAVDYNNIGYVYESTGEYNKALDYYIKDLKISLMIYDENNPQLGITYNNVGGVYNNLYLFDESLKYYRKALKIKQAIYNEKHPEIALTYNNLALVYYNQGEFENALKNFQLSIYSNTTDFVDTTNLEFVPIIKNYMDYNELLSSFEGKAKILASTEKNKTFMSEISDLDKQQIALNHYLACDTLISTVRKEISTQSDKIALGETASEIYKQAAYLSYKLGFQKTELFKNCNEKSFYFSERNKSSVLLEALAGSNALKFAGIPADLLEKEQTLNIEIANCKILKNNASNDSIANIHVNRLFELNRTYDSLIVVFENNYPDYYQLKYNNSPVKIEQIQQMLDKKTAMLNYFVLDSFIITYFVSSKDFEIYKTRLTENFNGNIEILCNAIQSNKKTSVFTFNNLAYEFYKLLFPEEMTANKSFKNIKSLIIIPDGDLATIPFEALFTEDYTKEWTSWEDTKYFSEMPFLIKKYNVSYSYSSTLFFNTFPKASEVNIQISNLKDIIALAPVFDDNATMNDGTTINPLPGSLTEVQNIFKIFNNSGLNADTKTRKQANEEFVKSGELDNYKYLHFATHGFVNTEIPELSGILLAQDSISIFSGNEDIFGNIAQQNDGILYQSEIYNLNLNSDLVVLSACETGLGKITSGEGVIGLTRALLYAGTKNIIVSLWSVSDESTSELMINFYDNLLKNKKAEGFSDDLQKAKLKLIDNGIYAHPFYWSPFILIGE